MFKKDHFAKRNVNQENLNENIEQVGGDKKLHDDDKSLNDSDESENEINKSDDDSKDKKSHSDDSDTNEDDDEDSSDNSKHKNKVDDDDEEEEDYKDKEEEEEDNDNRKQKRKDKNDDDDDDSDNRIFNDDSESENSTEKKKFQKKILKIRKNYYNHDNDDNHQKNKNGSNCQRKSSSCRPLKKHESESESESEDESSDDRHTKSSNRTGQSNSYRYKAQHNINKNGSKRPFQCHNANNNNKNTNNYNRNANNNSRDTNNYNRNANNNRYNHHNDSNNRYHNGSSHSRYYSSSNDYRDPYNSMYSNINRTSTLAINNKDERGRKLIAQQTCSIIQKRQYEFKKEDGTFETIDISNEMNEMISGTQTLEPNSFRDLVISKEKNPKMCKIEIVDSTSYGSAYHLYHQNQMKKVCVLNFASATKPGGGFINGKQAQEEALSRQSALYASLITQPKMYAFHNNEVNFYYYSDYMIYSPSVPVFRDDKKEKLLPKKDLFCVSVITSAAPYLKKVKEKSRDFERRFKSHYEKLVLNRIRKIVKLAAYHKNDALVLGAYGCGVFENDPKIISKAFKTVLIDEEYGKYFDIVTFPIMNLSSNNGRVFTNEFRDYL